jgi:signal transduction histidine kinase
MSEVALECSQSSGQYRDALANTLEEAARLNETINGLLPLARVESSQPGEAHTVFRLRDLLDEVLGVLEVLIEEKQIGVLQEESAAQSDSLRADRGLLRIALMNVLHNAVKYLPTRRAAEDLLDFRRHSPAPGHSG